MADSVATLYVEVDAKDVKQATAALARFEKESKSVEKQNNRTQKSNSALASSFSSISGAIKGYIALLGAREFVQAADTYTNIENKLKNVTETTEELVKVQNELFNVAQETRSSLVGTVDLYQRFALATESSSISSERLFAITKALQQAFIVSGATAQEASSAVLQLGQGLGSGFIRGQEYNSISEQGVRVTRALADSLGLTIGQLRVFANEGKLTSDVFLDAFEKQIPTIGEEFKKLDSTIDQSITKLDNSFTVFVGNLDDVTRASSAAVFIVEGFASGLSGLSNIMETTGAMFKDQLGFFEWLGMGPDEAKEWIANNSEIDRQLVALQSRITDLQRFSKGSIYKDTKEKYNAEIAEIESEIKRLLALQGAENVPKDSWLLRVSTDAKSAAAGLKAVSEIEEEAEKKREDAAKKQASALESIRQKIAELNAEESGNLEQQIAAKYANLAAVLGETNPKLQELIDLEVKLEKQKIQDKGDKARREQEKENTKSFKEQLAERREALSTFNEEMAAKEEERLQNSRDVADGMERAFRDYVDAATDDAAQIESVLSGAFNSAEDELVNFITTGKASFSDFANSIIQDLARIAAQKAIAGVISSIGSSGVFGGALDFLANANGNAFNSSGVMAFANGGVVNSATQFTYGGGQLGVMGEAGPEAILPLQRGPGGKLGVQSTAAVTNVIVQNNSSEQATTQESTDSMGNKEIRVIIGDMVNENIARGTHDRALQSTFGISRKGV